MRLLGLAPEPPLHIGVDIMYRTLPFLMLCLAAGAVGASAQQPATPPAQLQIEQMDSGWVIAPDAKFGQINDRNATFAGVYGGWSIDHTFLVGGGGYWLANRDHDFTMAYGGPVVAWVFRGEERVGFAVRALVGGGSATIARPFGEFFGTAPVVATREVARFGRTHGGHPITGFDSNTRVAVHEDFFIAEPQIGAVWRVTDWIRIDAGVGYRLIGFADLVGEHLRGASGSVSVRFGAH